MARRFKLGFSGDTFLLVAAMATLSASVYALAFLRFPSARGRHTIAWVKASRALERRSARSLAWEEVHDEDDLFAGDLVHIPPSTDAQAVIGEKIAIRLPAGATVRIVEAGGGRVEALPVDPEPAELRVYPRGDYAPADPAELDCRLRDLGNRLAKAGTKPVLPVKPLATDLPAKPGRRSRR